MLFDVFLKNCAVLRLMSMLNEAYGLSVWLCDHAKLWFTLREKLGSVGSMPWMRE